MVARRRATIPVRGLSAARAGLVAALLASPGCYAFVATRPETSLEGKDAQLELSDSGAVVLSAVIGPSASAIAGKILSDANGTYVVALASVHLRDGEDVRWRGEHIAVPRTLIVGKGERRFSPSRTALFGGIIAAGLVAAREAFAGRGAGSGGGGISGSGAPR
jgi:hypothetical protein